MFLLEKKAPAGAPEAAKSLENTMKIQKTDKLELKGIPKFPLNPTLLKMVEYEIRTINAMVFEGSATLKNSDFWTTWVLKTRSGPCCRKT